MPIKGEEETSSYEVVCAYQRGGDLCLSKGRRGFVPIKGEEGVCAYQRGGGDLFVQGGLCLSKGRRGVVPIKGEEETCSYEVVCAYQRGGKS